ncbi:unnamed protein product [Scytosiphon promiscuus]
MGRRSQLHKDGLLGGPKSGGGGSETAGSNGHASRVPRLGRSPNGGGQGARGGGHVHPTPPPGCAGPTSSNGRALATAGGTHPVRLEAVGTAQPRGGSEGGVGGILRPRHQRVLVPGEVHQTEHVEPSGRFL